MTEAYPPPVERPAIRLPRQGLPGLVIAVGAIAAAMLLFVLLDARRHDRVAPRTGAGPAFVAPPPVSVPLPRDEPTSAPAMVRVPSFPVPPRMPEPIPPTTVVRMPSALPSLPPAIVPVAPVADVATPHGETREKAPSALVIDTGPDSGAGAARSSPAGTDANGEQARAGGIVASGPDARATTIRNRSQTVPIGTLIPIVLETPIDTARPGLARAVVSTDTRGFDGRRVLIPRGSRLIGEYQADVRPGQNRVLVNWTRLIRPDGVAIQLASPAADELGGAGVPGTVHSFFLQRFAGALLQSALTIGVNLASRPRAGSVVVGIPSGPITTVGQNLVPTNEPRPKITVRQGAALNVFVARDLDFAAPGGRGER